MKETEDIVATANLLLLEQDPGLRKSVRLTLELDGLEVREAGDEADARTMIEARTPDLILLDHENMGESLGDLIELYRGQCAETGGIVLVTTGRRIDDRWRMQYRPDMVVYKPFDVGFLSRRIRELI